MSTVSELIAAEEAAGTATPADVRDAEREAAQAADQVTSLEQRVVDGDDEITPEAIEKAKSLRGFAKLRAEAVRRKAERTARAQWLRQCDELRGEIEGYAPGAGEHLAKLLARAEKAVQAFADATAERNTQLAAWRQRMHDLQVPEHNNPLIPPADQGHIGHYSARVIAGRRRMEPFEPDHLIMTMLHRVRYTPAGVGSPARPLRLDQGSTESDGLYERLAQIDAAPADNSASMRFFRNRTGGVIAVDVQALAAEPRGGGENFYQQQIARGDLVEISRKEAWGQ